MSPAFYLRYATRSLRRGGQRTLLGVFCVAVGVMAVVSLQLAALMIQQTLVGSARESNGGDVSLTGFQPLRKADLTYFDGLKSSGVVTRWTATALMGATARKGSEPARPVLVQVVDPTAYPLVGTKEMLEPAGGSFDAVLATPGRVVLSASMADIYGARVGDRMAIQTSLGPLDVSVGGVARDDGFFAALSIFVGRPTMVAAARSPVRYDNAYFLTSSAAASADLKKRLAKRYPTYTVQTVDDVLQGQKEFVGGIRKLLSAVGLIALGVGGIGIVHTMQVLLSRRRLEIAVLKTEGYRPRDLYVMFGLEAALLGLVGGVLGSLVGLLVSAGVRAVMEQAILVKLYYSVDLPTLGEGVLIGVATALIFGLLPIVRAARIRPHAVLRDLPDPRRGHSTLGTALLLGLVTLLFAVFASAVIGDPVAGFEVTAGSVIILVALNLAFRVLLRLMLVYQVPERMSIKFGLVMGILVLGAIGFTVLVPPVGGIVLAFLVAGVLAAFLPAQAKATAKLALRGIGRDRGRSAATLVALYVGIFAIALIVVLAVDTKAKADAILNSGGSYTVQAQDSAARGPIIQSAIPSLPGLKAHGDHDFLATGVISVKGTPFPEYSSQLLRQDSTFDASRLSTLSDYLGYDLSAPAPHQQLATKDNEPWGRLLNASDAGTSNVVALFDLYDPPISLRPGDQVVVADPATGRRATLTIVGFYSSMDTTGSPMLGLVGDRAVLDRMGPDALREFNFKVDPARKDAFIRALAAADPQAEIVDAAGFEAIVIKFIGNFVILLLALASLSLAAAAVIIANAVALAMLERRREMGIMKSVGFASGGLLAQVAVENAMLGAIGGASALAGVGLVTFMISRQLLGFSLDTNPVLELAIVGGAMLLCVVVAVAVATPATRTRPLDTLRYE